MTQTRGLVLTKATGTDQHESYTGDCADDWQASNARSADKRIIETLPLHLAPHHTPYFKLEFDSIVQNHCRNQKTGIILQPDDSGLSLSRPQTQAPVAQRRGSWTARLPSLSSLSSLPSSAFSSSTSTSTSTSTSSSSSSRSCSASTSSSCSASSATSGVSSLAPTFPNCGDSLDGESPVRNFKVVVCGDVAVGKTCLVRRFSGGQQASNAALRTHQTTIGVDFDLQRFQILGQSCVLQLWDTAGLERFRCITSAYYRGCQAALIVFDMANMSSLAGVMRWRDEVLAGAKTYQQLEAECGAAESGRVSADVIAYEPDNDCHGTQKFHTDEEHDNEPLLFLVGTKSDLEIGHASRDFMAEQANRLAVMLRAELWFVSARTGDNVEALFERVAGLAFNRAVAAELRRAKFDASTMGSSLRAKLMAQQRDWWSHSSKLIKITKKKEGDERRTRCVNIQCVIK